MSEFQPLPKFYNKRFVEYIKDFPLIHKQNWWVRLNLFFAFSRIIGADSNGYNQTIVYGKKFNGKVYITKAKWCE